MMGGQEGWGVQEGWGEAYRTREKAGFTHKISELLVVVEA